MAGAGHSSDEARILKEFLCHPLNPRRQLPFVHLCVRLATRYLRFFQARGWKLPVNQQIDGSPIRDLAIDMVGLLLASKPGRPYYMVFDFFRKRGIANFEKTDTEEILDLFKSLVYGWVRQERSNLLDEDDPQKALLKRAFTDFFKTHEVMVSKSKGSLSDCVCLARYVDDIREDLPFIEFDELLRLAEEAFHVSTTRRGWCRAIFDRLNDLKSVRNCVEKHLLLRAVVTVNMKYVDLKPAVPASQDFGGSIPPKRIEKMIQLTLDAVNTSVLAGFIAKGRLESDRAQVLLLACGDYLRDFAFSAGLEAIPVYFREVMPDEEHPRYLKEYKHVFETLISSARQEFIDRLRKYLQCRVFVVR